MIERPVHYDDQVIYGQLFLPEGQEDPVAAVICSHFFGGTHRNSAEYARAFAAAGFVSYAFDYCGGSPASRSSGRTTDHSLLTERDDLLAVLEMVRSLPQVDVNRVFLEGQSQGGAVSTLAAAERPREIAGLILCYPAFVIPEHMVQRFGAAENVPTEFDLWMRLGHRYAVDAMGIDFEKVAARYPGPVLIFQGSDDGIEPAFVTQRVAAHFPQALCKIVQGAGHGFYGVVQRRVIAEAASFVENGRLP